MNPIALWMTLLPLAAEPAKKQGEQSSPYSFMIMMVLMFVVIYFLMIHPQRKRQRERTTMLDALSKGDKIITVGGIHGVVTLVRDREVVVKVDDDGKLTLSKSGISRILPPEGAESKDEKK